MIETRFRELSIECIIEHELHLFTERNVVAISHKETVLSILDAIAESCHVITESRQPIGIPLQYDDTISFFLRWDEETS